MADRYYKSPRWSAELLDCSMPMTFDTYNLCTYQCMYCFSYYQRSHTEDYVRNHARSVDVARVKRIFLEPDYSQFKSYVEARIPLQWGGLSEPFDKLDKKFGATLELMKFFREIDYPVSFSTKSTWMLKEAAYREQLKDAKNFHFKVSIITLDEEKARKIEKGVPTPEERLWAIKELVNLGVVSVNLRLRPFIIGVTNPTHLELVRRAKEAGATGVSTEFFCLEARANADLKKRYKEMSAVVGYDLWEFYRRFSRGSGYKRLNYEIKRKYTEELEDLCKELGLELFVSDAHHKEKSSWGSCCGVPNKGAFSKYAKCQFTQAIVFAKKHGEVRFSDMTKHYHQFLKDITYKDADGFNTGSLVNRAKHGYRTMYDYLRSTWNDPKAKNSPYQYFDNLLLPDRLDENGDIVYKFNEKKHARRV